MPIRTGLPLNKTPVEPDVKARWRRITAARLLSAARQYDSKWAPYVRFIRVKKINDNGQLAYRFETRTYKPNVPPTRSHFVTIKARNPLYTGPINKSPAIQINCDCFVGSTRVLTSKGWQTIHELVDPNKNPTKDFPIKYNVNGILYKGSAPWAVGQKYVYHVDTANGDRIIGTKNQKIRVLLGKTSKLKRENGKQIYLGQKINYGWKTIGELKPGDKIVLHTVKNIEQTEFNRKYWHSYLLGAFHGDGCFNPFSMEIHSHKKIIRNIQKDGVKLNLFPSRIGTYGFNNRAREILAKFKVSNNSRHYLNIDKANIYAVLSGLIDTDGCVHKDGRVDIIGQLQLKVIADKLKELGIIGVKFNLYRKKGVITNYSPASRDSYCLSVSTTGMRQIRHNLKSIKYDNYVDKKVIHNYLNVAKVVSIKRGGRSYVYDIHVPKIHQFVAESMIVHNCQRFTYHYEYALWYYGAAEMLRCNGQYPVVTNSRLRIGACKHCIHSLQALITSGL